MFSLETVNSDTKLRIESEKVTMRLWKRILMLNPELRQEKVMIS